MPDRWFWSKHSASTRARRIFRTATLLFAALAIYLVASSAYIKLYFPPDANLGFDLGIANQIGVLVFIAITMAILLRRGIINVANAHGQVSKIVENMSDYFYAVGPDWTYTFVNRRLAGLLQKEPQDLVGKSLWDFMPRSLQPELRLRYTEAKANKKSQRLELFIEEFEMWIDMQIYPDSDGLAVFFQDITARKLSQETLRANNLSFQSVVNSAMDGVISLDADQNIILFNHAAETMFQVKAAEMIGQPVTVLMPERSRLNHMGHVRDFDSNAVTTRRMGALGEVYGLRADGSEFPIEVSISKTGDGRNRVFTAIIRDITEKKRAQQQLDQKIRQQVALAQFGIASSMVQQPHDLFERAADVARENLNADYATIVEVNPEKTTVKIVATSGWSPGEKTEIALSQISKDGLVPRLLSSGGVIHFTDVDKDPALTSDDVLIRLHVRSGLGLAMQAVYRYTGMIYVLSKESRAFSEDDADFLRTLSNVVVRARESQISLNTLRLRDKALASITQGITITDEKSINHAIIYTNAAFARMLGYRPDEIIGVPPQQFLAHDTPPGTRDRIALMRAKQRAESMDIRLRRRDGTSFLDHMAASPIFGPTGELLHYVGVHEDITEARQRDQQLQESQKMEVVGQLTGGIAHDFNNLLTVVRANAEDMKSNLAHDEMLLEQTDMILQAADRGAALIRQMMAFARKQELAPVDIDLNAHLESFVKLVRRTLQENITLDLRCEPGLPFIHVDPGRLESAVLNMILNARDAMPDGGAIVMETAVKTLDREYARQNADAQAGTYVMLAITDSGSGMSKEIAEKAFQPFFTTKAVGKGTGLGLSMVYGFLRQSGGHAKIYSEESYGTTVRIYLPLASGQPEAIIAAQPEKSVTETTSGSILVVEDDELVRKSVGDRLQRMGFTINTVENAAEAIIALESNPDIDMIFTDVIMPGAMTGADLAREVKRRWPSVRILMTSGYTAASALGKINMPSDVPLLSKPYSLAQLRTALNDVFSKPAH